MLVSTNAPAGEQQHLILMDTQYPRITIQLLAADAKALKGAAKSVLGLNTFAMTPHRRTSVSMS
jgi:tRNA threonylcarbamoyladenosine modification (KEOPS) complex  Pcc1 subunit